MTSNRTFFIGVVAALFVVESLSYVAYFFPVISLVTVVVIALLTLGLSLKDVSWGLLVVVAEWVIGSQGYILSLTVDETRISLRIILWIIVMAVWGAKLLLAIIQKTSNVVRSNTGVQSDSKGKVNIYTNFKKLLAIPYGKPIGFIIAILVLGLFVGLIFNNNANYLVLEAKRWLYILIWLPLLQSFSTKEQFKKLGLTLLAAITVLCLQAFVLIYIFSHIFIPLVYDVYGWMRLDLLGEITRLPNGFSRVFMQSQIFLLPAFLVFFVVCIQQIITKKWPVDRLVVFSLIGSVLTWSVIIASLSRSFWLGLAGGLGVVIIISFFLLKPHFKKVMTVLGLFISVSLLSAVWLFTVIRFPLPTSTAQLDPSLLTERANALEAGAASRWALLPVMWQEISQAPLLGYGFGKTLTYYTSDPRITSTTVDGEYTTYAFEWGWLDIWLKLGLVGVIMYIWLLVVIFKDGLRLFKSRPLLGSAIVFSVVALAIVHFFTPYLNHPLGFGYLGLVMLAARKYEEI